VARATGRAFERQDAFHHVGIGCAPLEGLGGAHRPSGHQLEFADPEFLGDQLVLQA
jgi:hypothetical protein